MPLKKLPTKKMMTANQTVLLSPSLHSYSWPSFAHISKLVLFEYILDRSPGSSMRCVAGPKMKYGNAVIKQEKARKISPIPIKKARLYRSDMYPITGLKSI